MTTFIGRVIATYDDESDDEIVFQVESNKSKNKEDVICKYDLPIKVGDTIAFIGKRKKNKDIEIIAKPLVRTIITKRMMTNFLKKRNCTLTVETNKQAEILAEKISKYCLLINTSKMGYDRVANIMSNDFGKVTKNKAKYILSAWEDLFDNRQLILFGFTEAEISSYYDDILMPSKRELINKIRVDPLKVYQISWSRCDKLIKLFNRKTTTKDEECAKLIRIMWKQLQSNFVSISTATLKKYRNITEEFLSKYYDVVIFNNQMYLREVFNIEKSLAQNILGRLMLECPSVIKDKNLVFSENITSEQKNAVSICMNNTISLITGEARTGKTRVTSEIVQNFNKQGITYVMLAPTGAAVERMREVMGDNVKEDRTMTIDMYCTINDRPKAEYIIIDEASMLSYILADKLFSRIPAKTKLILIGDIHQLEPINFGRLFEQLFETGCIASLKLTKNFRVVSKKDPILINAQKVITEFDEFFEADNFTVCEGWMAEIEAMISFHASAGIPLEELTIMSPFRNYGGDREFLIKLNDLVWKYYCPHSNYRTGFQVGKRVMVTKNNKDFNVYNGQEGIITKITNDYIIVDFKSREERFSKYSSDPKELLVRHLNISFARTVHSAQGSEYSYCIGVIPKSRNLSFLNYKMMYTLMTRARLSLTLIGDTNTMIAAIRSIPPNKGEGFCETLNLELTGILDQ